MGRRPRQMPSSAGYWVELGRVLRGRRCMALLQLTNRLQLV